VAGIVTTVKHATSKNGKPYGSFTVEDYSDSFSITLFAKDYENFRKYMYESYSLLIKGSMQENNWRKNGGELEFRIRSINMLSSVREEMIHNIELSIPLNALSEEMIKDIVRTGDTDKGNANLKVIVFDREEKISVEMFSRYKKINISDELLSYLENNDDINYRLY